MKYSPGMKTKLSYAVTTVHEPDILLLDEVFSVGDQEFQERCLEHFKQLKKENKIIIFVTNNPIQANKISDVRYKLKKGQLFKP